MLFHRFDDDCDDKTDLIHCMMVIKHVLLYRTRFNRENVGRRPTVRMLLLTLIIELRKLVSSRRRT